MRLLITPEEVPRFGLGVAHCVVISVNHLGSKMFFASVSRLHGNGNNHPGFANDVINCIPCSGQILEDSYCNNDHIHCSIIRSHRMY